MRATRWWRVAGTGSCSWSSPRRVRESGQRHCLWLLGGRHDGRLALALVLAGERLAGEIAREPEPDQHEARRDEESLFESLDLRVAVVGKSGVRLIAPQSRLRDGGLGLRL